MIHTTVGIDGMACGMCESHIADVIRKTFPDAKHVKASHRKHSAEFDTENTPDLTALKAAIDATGYHYLSADSTTVEKKRGFFH